MNGDTRFLFPLKVCSMIALVWLLGYSFYYGEYAWLITTYLLYKVIETVGEQIGFHRYFSHRSFKTTMLGHQILCWTGVILAQGTPLGSTAIHRSHHKMPDTPDDIHSPIYMSWWQMFKLQFMTEAYYKDKKVAVPRDLLRDKTVMFIHNNYFYIWLCYLAISLLIGWKFFVFFTLSIVGWNVIHGSFRIYLYHLNTWGSYRNFDIPGDYSTNNQWLHWYDLGEGLHNNHHKYPGSYSMAVKPGEYDPAAWVVKYCFEAKDGNSYIF
jgi:stearoyl-CoA desaturase (delta-9 desaturase)